MFSQIGSNLDELLEENKKEPAAVNVGAYGKKTAMVNGNYAIINVDKNSNR